VPRLLGIWSPQDEPLVSALRSGGVGEAGERGARAGSHGSFRDERKPVPIDEDEEEEEVAEDEDSHENVCNDCQETGELYCCSTCRHAYHEDCLSYAARAGLSEEDWRCPVCTGVFPRRAIGNPQAGKAQACAKRRARKRARGEAAPSAGRAAKRATYARSKAAGTAPPRLR